MKEVHDILHRREGEILIDKKVRRDNKFPMGFMDVVEIPKMKLAFRVLYDVKRRFVFTKIPQAETNFKLCRVEKKLTGPNKLTYIVTHDGRTLRFVDGSVHLFDTIKFNLVSKQVEEIIPMKVGSLVFCSTGNNRGRVGTVVKISILDGSNNLVTVKDALDRTFTTVQKYIFVIGTNKSMITLPRDKGVRQNISEE